MRNKTASQVMSVVESISKVDKSIQKNVEMTDSNDRLPSINETSLKTSQRGPIINTSVNEEEKFEQEPQLDESKSD